MNQLLLDYLPLAVFLGVALLIGGALMLAPFLVMMVPTIVPPPTELIVAAPFEAQYTFLA